MRIGIDAGALGITDERLKVGVYRVIVNLLRELTQLDVKNEYILYSFNPIDRKLMHMFGPITENRVLWPIKGWFTMRLLLELRMHPVDVFLGLSQAVPHGCKGVIGFVYDVGFLYHPDAYPGSYQRLTLQTKNLVSRSERIIAISKSVKQDLMKEYSIDASRVTVAYPGVDAQFGISVDPLVSQHPYFLFVGALKRGKNIAMLLYAFSRFLSQSEKRYDLYIVGGDYWKDPEIETVIAEKNLSKRVILMGHVPDNDLPAYYQGAAAFVSPSLHEGFCLPAAEAMACGCPVIGSTTGAMPEIIGNAGITVNPGDANAIALAMETVSSRPRTRMAMSKKGLRKAQKFSWRTFAETVFEAIQSV